MRLRLFASGALLVPASMLLFASTSGCSGDDTNVPGPPAVDASADVDASLPHADGGTSDGSTDATTSDTGSPDTGTDAPITTDGAAPDSSVVDSGLETFDATSPGPAGGQFSLHFAGGQYLRIPYAGALAQSAVTIEAWVKIEAPPGYFCAVCLPFGSGTQDSYGLWVQPLLAGASDPGGDVTTDFEPSLGEWHHLALTGDPANGLALYVDGGYEANATTWSGTPAQYDGHDLLIGADMDNGVLDGFMLGEDRRRPHLEQRARPGADRGRHARPQGRPFAESRGERTFDEGSGTVAHDSSGLGLDAILGDGQSDGTAPTWVALPASGDD